MFKYSVYFLFTFCLIPGYNIAMVGENIDVQYRNAIIQELFGYSDDENSNDIITDVTNLSCEISDDTSEEASEEEVFMFTDDQFSDEDESGLQKASANSFLKRKKDFEKDKQTISKSIRLSFESDSEEHQFGREEQEEINQASLEQINLETKQLLAMYELINFDKAIFDKSLIEVLSENQKASVIEKFMAYKSLMNEPMDLNEQDDQGKTALLSATQTNNENIVRLLTERGASVNMPDHQACSPLHAAVRGGYIPIANYLIAQNALINSQNAHGETPLHIAINNANLEMIKLLLAANPVLSILDHNQNTPLNLVIKTKIPALIRLFREYEKNN